MGRGRPGHHGIFHSYVSQMGSEPTAHTAAMAGGAESERMESLLRWAADVGVSDSPSSPSHPPTTTSSSSSSCLGHSLCVSFFPEAGGRGLAAARDLRRGDLLLRVPRAALLTRDGVLPRDGKLAACVKRHPRLSSAQILTVCLLAEVGKGKDSWWYPYLVQLPRNYDTLANFTQFEIRALQVEDAILVAETAVLKAESDWKEAVLLMQEIKLRPQLLTFKSWLWASATISSRTLHIPWDDAGCLCPVGDLFNYAAPEEECCHENNDDYCQRLTDGGYEEDTSSYCFYARKRYRKGDQVLLGYGTYTNLDLLEHYGFLLMVNPNDKAFIQLDRDIYTFCCWPKDYLCIQPDGSPSFALLCALRLWATPVKLRRAIGHRAHTGSILSAENELLIMKWLGKRCTGNLGKMLTTIEHDGLLLATMDKILYHPSCLDGVDISSCNGEILSFFEANGLQNVVLVNCQLRDKVRRSLERWKLAVRWRFIHKKMLLNCISYCNEIISRLTSPYVSTDQQI